MSSTKKTLIGILTFLPLIFLGLYMFTFFRFFLNIEQIQDGNTPAEIFGDNFAMLFLYIGLFAMLSIGMLIFYIIDITKNPKFQHDSTNKLVWILIVLFAGTVGMAVYFFMEIYPRKEDEELDPF